VAGKTGTAQLQQPGQPINHITWFASYAASEERPYVVLVMLETGTRGSGGGSCAPVAAKVYDAIERLKGNGSSAGQGRGELM
jgi:cell division protein FtsI/penicillin-binding protein 2